jgi:hypothetical protein
MSDIPLSKLDRIKALHRMAEGFYEEIESTNTLTNLHRLFYLIQNTLDVMEEEQRRADNE